MSATASPREALGWRSLAVTAALVSGAAVLLVGLLTAVGPGSQEAIGWDFRVAFYPAAEAVAQGESPYPADPSSPQPGELTYYHYPPQLALLLVPVTALSVDVAAVAAVVASIVAVLAALAIVGLRDVRCYAATILWAPTWNAFEMANVSALLALLLALVWRFRDRLWPAATVLGTMVSLKLFLWPVTIWAVATRRGSAALLAVAVGVALTIGSWAVIGFQGLRTYPELVGVIDEQESYSINGLADSLGLSTGVAYAITACVTLALLVVCVNLARRGDETRAFFVAVVAALAVSPVVWLHYLVLLAVPLALVRPRFSGVWLLPVVLWVVPRSGNGDGLEPFLAAAVVAALAALALAAPRAAGSEAVRA